MNVKLFKLMNGQELVTEFVSVAGRGYMIRRPLVVHVMRGADGNPTLGFAEWSLVAEMEKPFELYDAAVMAGPLDVMPEVAQSYEQQMTGLILPPTASGQILHG